MLWAGMRCPVGTHVSGSNGAAHTSPGYNPGIGVQPQDQGRTPPMRSEGTRESSASPTQSITYPAYPERCSGLVCDVPLGHTCPAPTEPRIPARGTTPGTGYNPGNGVQPRERGATPGTGCNPGIGIESRPCVSNAKIRGIGEEGWVLGTGHGRLSGLQQVSGLSCLCRSPSDRHRWGGLPPSARTLTVWKHQ